ncbi:MAG: glycosyltransferase family 4 protein [bacterium]|nr:glycosyltransferase family 4 protein [bacterium]
MKILIFSTAYLPFVGGAELAIKEITDRLGSPSPLFRGGIEGGVSFDLITLNLDRKQRPEEVIGNVRVIRLSCSKLLFPFQAFMRARKLHHENPYTHVWSVMASYGGFAGLFFKHHFPKVPFILTLQEGDSFSHIYRRVFFVWPLFKMIFTRADHITAISNYLADWARRMGAKAEIHIVPNGVDVNQFKVKSEKSKVSAQGGSASGGEEKRKELGFSSEEKVIITTSRLVPKNGIEDLIQAMRYLQENVKLLILGSGALESDLKLKTSNLQLAGRVTFLGYMAHTELPHYLHLSNIFVRASRSEGMGSSFIEAMAAGLPVVATRVGGIPDFLMDGETGLFCEVRNPKSIAEKVQLLLSNDELRNRITANASKMVRERYEWDGVVEQMKKVFVDKA